MLLGRVTDTQDISGATLEEHEVTVQEEEVRRVIASFVGEYMQVPPMYSVYFLPKVKNGWIAAATPEMGMVWSQLLPGPVRTVLNSPSPPSTMFLSPLTC